MNIFEIEKRRGEVLQDLVYCTTPRQKLLIIRNFFTLLLEQNNPALFEAYSVEFIEIYLAALSSWSPMYMHPSVTEAVLEQMNLILNLSTRPSVNHDLKKYSAQICEKLTLLKQYLAGTALSSGPAKLCFPVLEIQDHTYTKIRAGLLETVTIKISKSKGQDKFLIVPLTGNPEEKLSEQIKISWNLALQYVKQHIRKVDKYHEVMIHFDGRLGNYIGYSLGLTLTIGFIEELLKFYNAPYLVNIKSNIALTGGIDGDGHLLSVGKAIEEKVDTIVFSGTGILILPDDDKPLAENRLLQLKREFPQREISLVGADKLQDVINRRDLIDIRKQNPAVRTLKRLRDNSIIVLLLILLISLSSYYGIRDYDDNPAIFMMDGYFAFVKNSSGRLLWKKNTGMRSSPALIDRLEYIHCILDVNNDGKNEVIITEGDRAPERSRIVCFDKNGELIWKYAFHDTVYSLSEGYIKPFYGSPIILGIDTLNNSNYEIYLSVSNLDSYPAAIFRIDAGTGKRLPGTLWNDGHINSGKFYKQNGQREVVFVCHNNSFERVGICRAEVSDSVRMCPNKKERGLLGIKPATVKDYILVPNSDYNKFFNFRNTIIYPYSYNFDTNLQTHNFGTIENPEFSSSGICYKTGKDFKTVSILILTDFRVKRDSLVAAGKLNPPFTDTKEYCELLKSQILYWNGKTFEKAL